jgi:hypothetical protein
VLPFTAGEMNLVVQPGPSGSAAISVLLDGKAVGDARGPDVGTDGVARFRWAPHDSPGRRFVATTARADPGDERSGLASVRLHCRTLEHARSRPLVDTALETRRYPRRYAPSLPLNRPRGLYSRVPVGERGTLRDVSQSPRSRPVSDCKYLILNGEMSEWFKEHAWKAKRASETEPLRRASTHTRSAT